MRRLPSAAPLLALLLSACAQSPPLARVSSAQARQSTADAERAATSSFVPRRVWADAVDMMGAPSPDGRFVSFVDWSTGDLAVRDLVAGQNRRVTNKGTWETSNQSAERSVISPDGSRIAYSWLNEKDTYEMRVIGVDGSGPRTVFSGEDIYTWPVAWTADGRQVLTIIHLPDKSNQLALVPAEGGEPRVLRAFDWRWPNTVGFSHDGKYIAYGFPPDQDEKQNDIYLLSVDGSRETRVVSHPANEAALGWEPGGDRLLFVSDRGGPPGVYAVRIENGRAAGDPELVRPDIYQVEPMGASRSGIFYGVTVSHPDVHAVDVDLEGRKVVGTPAPLHAGMEVSTGADWSPDGRRAAFIIRRDSPGRRLNYLAIKSLETGEVHEIPARVDDARRVRWAPSGQSILFGGNSQARPGIFVMDLRTGKVTPIVRGGGGVNLGQDAYWSADGGSIYYRRTANDSTLPGLGVLKRSVASGEERLICQCAAWAFSVSPDDRHLVYLHVDPKSRTETVRLLPTAGGPERIIYTFRPPETVHWRAQLPWTPDGRSLLFVRNPGVVNGPLELWRLPVFGGEPVRFSGTLPLPGPGVMRLHPDGRRLVFNFGEHKGEVWVLEKRETGAASHKDQPR